MIRSKQLQKPSDNRLIKNISGMLTSKILLVTSSYSKIEYSRSNDHEQRNMRKPLDMGLVSGFLSIRSIFLHIFSSGHDNISSFSLLCHSLLSLRSSHPHDSRSSMNGMNSKSKSKIKSYQIKTERNYQKSISMNEKYGTLLSVKISEVNPMARNFFFVL